MNLFCRIIVAAACAIAPAAVTPAARATTDTETFPAVLTHLVDQSDHAFDPASTDGRLVLVNFIFTGCGTTCPTQMMQLAKFDRSLPPAIRRRLMLISVSVDPANDRPKTLKTYGQLFGADGRRWKLLTGMPHDIARVTRAFSAFAPGEGKAAFHTSEVRLFDARHRMIQRYVGAPLAERQLHTDLIAVAAMKP